MLHNNPWIHKHLHRSRHLQKLIFHGPAHRRAAAPSGPLSYCFGMATSGEPSTWLPLGKLEGQEPLPLLFSRNFEIFEKSHHFSTFWKSLEWIELWNFKVSSIFQYHFYKLQYMLQNYYSHSHDTFTWLLFHGRIYRGALVPSGSLSYCFGITLLLERNLLPFELLFRATGVRSTSRVFVM